jgi:hypothetical protein
LIFSFSGARKTDGETITYVFFDLVLHPLCEPESGLKDSQWRVGRTRAEDEGYTIPTGNADVIKKKQIRYSLEFQTF